MHSAVARHPASSWTDSDIQLAAKAVPRAHTFSTGTLWPYARLVEVGARLRGPGYDDKVAASSSLQAGSSIGELSAARTRLSPRQHSFYNPHTSRRPSLLSTDQPPCSLVADASIALHCGSTAWSYGNHRTRPSCTLRSRSNVTLSTTCPYVYGAHLRSICESHAAHRPPAPLVRLVSWCSLLNNRWE